MYFFKPFSAENTAYTSSYSVLAKATNAPVSCDAQPGQ